jgi:hypothetical protein
MTKKASINDLVVEARKLGHHRTKKEAVRAALDEYVRKRNQMRVFELFGKIDYDETYDYKSARRSKR